MKPVLIKDRVFLQTLQLSTRAAGSAAIAVAAAEAFGLPFPIYAMIAAVIVTDLDPAKTRQQCVPRLVGTLAGGLIGALVASWLPASPWAIGVAIFVPMFAFRAAGMADAAKLAGYVTAIVVMQHAGEAWMYAIDRVIETLVGIVCAVGVSFVPKVLHIEDPEAAKPAP